MAKYQAGMLVVYGNLGVREIETVGPQSFCGEPAKDYYTLRPYFSDSHDRSYIPTEKEDVLRPVSPAEQITVDLEKIKTEELPAPVSNNQTVLAEHYQAVIHTNDFYEYLKLYKELSRKQIAQRGRGRKVNAMDSHFYQMTEHVLQEELAAALHETQEDAGKRLAEAVKSKGPLPCKKRRRCFCFGQRKRATNASQAGGFDFHGPGGHVLHRPVKSDILK